MTKQQIHAAYLKQAMANHPDIHGEARVDSYVAIQEAYDQIKSGTVAQTPFEGFKVKEKRKQRNQADFSFMAKDTDWRNETYMFHNKTQSEHNSFKKEHDGVWGKVKFMFTRGK